MEGIFNIDKPVGISSHDVVNRLRRLTQVRRIGHAGTLDPLASGVMLLCVGRATRLVEYLVGHSKRYTATIRLGQETDSYDAHGEIIAERPYAHLTIQQIEETVATFEGSIEQLPPMYSAIKKDGQPLYKLARKGIDVERKTRTVTFYSLDILAWEPPNLIVDTHVSAGTYIRSLAHDLGQKLDCGGHITQLRRTAVGSFSLKESVALDSLTADNIGEYQLHMDTAVAHMPRLDLSLAQAQTLLNGRLIFKEDALPNNTIAAIYAQNQFWGLAIAKESRWKAHKMVPPISLNKE